METIFFPLILSRSLEGNGINGVEGFIRLEAQDAVNQRFISHLYFTGMEEAEFGA